MNNELYYFLIDGQQDGKTGIVGNFYAYGHHLGDALQKVIKVSTNHNFNNSNLTEASLLESFEVIHNNGELVEITDKVSCVPKFIHFLLMTRLKNLFRQLALLKV